MENAIESNVIMFKKIKELKRIRLLLLLPLSVIIILLCRAVPFIAEYVFARGIYKLITIPLGFVTGIFPFSIAEVMIVASPLILLGIIFVFARNIVKSKGHRLFVVVKGIINLGCFVSVALFLFVVMCGTNYYRYEISELVEYDVREYSKEELIDTCKYLKKCMEKEKLLLMEEHPDYIMQNGAVKYMEDFSVLAEKCKEAMGDLSDDIGALKYATGNVKEVCFSRVMSYGGIVGIFIPFTVESNVNTDVVDYNHPVDACHELVHMRGFMKEDEANFISYLACINDEDSYFRYSGYAFAFVHATNALYDIDNYAYNEIFSDLSYEVYADFLYEEEYWDDIHKDEIAKVTTEVMSDVNDTYLKANGEEDGVSSYGKMVDLVIAEYLYRMEE